MCVMDMLGMCVNVYEFSILVVFFGPGGCCVSLLLWVSVSFVDKSPHPGRHVPRINGWIWHGPEPARACLTADGVNNKSSGQI